MSSHTAGQYWRIVNLTGSKSERVGLLLLLMSGNELVTIISGTLHPFIHTRLQLRLFHFTWAAFFMMPFNYGNNVLQLSIKHVVNVPY